MRTEALLIIGITVLSIILLCLVQGINPWTLIQAHLPQLDSITTPLTEIVSPLVDAVAPIWTSIKDNPISHSITTLGTTATVSIIGKYLADYALRKRDEAHALITQEKDKLLANHNGELTELTKQRDDVFTLATQMKDSLTEKDIQIASQLDEIQALKDREQKLIEERNAALRIDKQKIVDDITEEVRKH